MLKYLVAVLIVVVLFAGGFFWLNAHIYNEKQGGADDFNDATYVIDGKPITLTDGIAEIESESGSSGTTVRFFGNLATGDLNDDGNPDVAFLVTQSSGGSGTFYYVVAALMNSAGRWVGTDAILLGDRIAPQSTEIRNGILIVNYADRLLDEPMTAVPTVGTSLYVYFNGERLVGVPPTGPITIDGTLTCVPPYATESPSTLECALGLLDDRGRYFMLRADSSHIDIAAVPTETRVRIDGVFKLQLGSKYEDIGVIEVEGIVARE